MRKEINEKTFELNITNELLNISKSFFWYLDHTHWLNFPTPWTRETISQFLTQATFFAEGLTQEEENNPLNGGYDVSINHLQTNGQANRVMFLQYKAGIRNSYCTKAFSKFYRQTAQEENRSPEHVIFTFNDAAAGTQHSTLRKLAQTEGITPKSVLYVFPRITERKDFINKIGSITTHSSFVPVIDIDNQAYNQIPPISIDDRIAHKYRTSYDGLTSEINFFYFLFVYNNKLIHSLLAELICIQIERLTNLIYNSFPDYLPTYIEVLAKSISQFIENELMNNSLLIASFNEVYDYLNILGENIRSNKEIPKAPSNYTTVLPKDGLKIESEAKIDFSTVKYQIF